MTYFQFLLVFLGIPIIILLGLTYNDARQERKIPSYRLGVAPWLAVLIHIIVAVLYTTPWDNYLVATGVWYYDPKLVSGIKIGWVPIEEYIFFMLQSLLAGLWLLFLARRIAREGVVFPNRHSASWLPIAILGMLWIGAVFMLFAGWGPGTYLGLILAWSIPPILLQFMLGGSILRVERRLLSLAVLSLTLYLSVIDSLAIRAGTWAISPQHSLNLLLVGVLPLEEVLFFLVTNILLVFGMALFLARESREQYLRLLSRLKFTKSEIGSKKVNSC